MNRRHTQYRLNYAKESIVEQKKKLVVDVRDKDDLELYYKTIPDYFEQDDGRKLTEVPDRTSTDMIEGTY